MRTLQQRRVKYRSDGLGFGLVWGFDCCYGLLSFDSFHTHRKNIHDNTRTHTHTHTHTHRHTYTHTRTHSHAVTLSHFHTLSQSNPDTHTIFHLTANFFSRVYNRHNLCSPEILYRSWPMFVNLTATSKIHSKTDQSSPDKTREYNFSKN